MRWFRRSRTTETVIFVVLSSSMMIAVQPFANNWMLLGIVFIPFGAYIEVLSRSARVAGHVFVIRNYIALLISFLSLALGAILGISFKNPIGSITFLATGGLVGVLAIRSLAVLSTSVLYARRRLLINLTVIAAACWGIVLFPWNSHSAEAGWYFWGVALGSASDRIVAWRFSRAAGAFRRLSDIADAWPPGLEATIEEIDAFRKLTQGRSILTGKFSQLRSHLEICRKKNGSLTPRMALISASAYRLEGKYLEALAELKPYENKDVLDYADAHIHILRVQTIEEISSDRSVHLTLERIRRSKVGSRCPITYTLLARRLAEEALRIDAKTLAAICEIKPDRRALALARRAERFRLAVLRERMEIKRFGTSVGDPNSVQLSHYLAKFSEIGIPFNSSTVMDVIGYSHLAAGFVEAARVHLEKCIEMDPVFSYGYLHLGDYYLLRNSIMHPELQPRREDKWHATACYHAALKVEINKNSRVRSLAQMRLELISADDPGAAE